MIHPLAFLKFVARQFHPSHFSYAQFALALVISSVGALIFLALRLPLPWMLGPMTACTLASLIRVPIVAPGIVRPPMQMVIGVMLGAGFTPAVLESAHEWVLTLAGLGLFILVCGYACVAYFRLVGRFDLPTAYFSGMPGGLVEMVILGESKGGDPRTIALIHSARILLVVFTLPFLIQFVTGVQLGPRPAVGVLISQTPWTGELWLVGTAVVGATVGYFLHLPAALLLGPVLISGIVHALGISDFQPATEIVNGAQLVLGTSIGCRFAGTPPRFLLRILALSCGSTLILLSITAAFALGVSFVSASDVMPLMLAYSPGGLAEMSLVALALQIEVAFVAAHHIARMFLVMIGAGVMFKLVRHR